MMMFLFSSSVAAQYVVQQTGGGTHTTIQSAINTATDGDEIVVMPGVYTERINFLGKAVRIRGSDPFDANIVAATIIDPDTPGTAVTFASGEGPDSVLNGLTIRGADSPIDGGGVSCTNNSSPLIVRNVIKANVAAGNGGGIFCASGAAPRIVDSAVFGNRCQARGGGVYAESSAPILERNVIDSNAAGCSAGGGVYLAAGTDAAILRGNQIVRNMSRLGGAIALSGSSPLIEQNRIERNVAMPRAGAISCSSADATIVNNFISGNRAEIAAALDAVNSDVVLSGNTIVGNWATDAAILLFLNGSHASMSGNIIAHSRNGVAVQALTGATVAAEHNCLFANAGGNFTGAVTQGPGHVFIDPAIQQVGTWAFTGLIDEGEGPPCDVGVGRVELVALIHGQASAFGTAQYRLRPDRERFILDVSGFPPGSHAVFVANVAVGQINVNGAGVGSLEYDTHDGNFPPSFPNVNVGDVVRVAAIASGDLVGFWSGTGDAWMPGNEHLRSNSPCRDAWPTSSPQSTGADIDGQPRASGPARDIGADEIAPTGTGDADQDLDVDFADVGRFQWCHTGSNPPSGLPDAACAALDFDADADVDAIDWHSFQSAITGPN